MPIPESVRAPEQNTSSTDNGTLGIPSHFIVKPKTVETQYGGMTVRNDMVVVREYSGPKIVSERVVTSEQLQQSARQEIIERAAAGGKHTAVVQVSTPEQVQDVRKWAKEEGYEVKRLEAKYDKDTGESTIPLRIVSERPLRSDTLIPVRGREQIRLERERAYSEQLGAEVYEKGTIAEKAGLGTLTLLRGKGTELVGSVVAYTSPLRPFLGDVKTPEQVIKEDVSVFITKEPTATETISEFFQSPVFAVESAFLLGGGLAKLGTTALGAKLLGSKAGQVAGGLVTVGFVGYTGYEAYDQYSKGETAAAIGTVTTSALMFGATVAGYKAQKLYYETQAKPVEINFNELTGASFTQEAGSVTYSYSGWKITGGKTAGLKGSSVSVVGKDYGLTTITIPEQTIGNIGIKKQVFTQPFKRAVDMPTGFSGQESGTVLITAGGKPIGVGGEAQASTLLRETDRRGLRGLLFREFKGASTAKEGQWDLVGVKGGGQFAIVDVLSAESASLTKIKWFDITAMPGKAPKPYRPPKVEPFKGEVDPFKPPKPEPYKTDPYKVDPMLKLEEPATKLEAKVETEPIIPALQGLKLETTPAKVAPLKPALWSGFGQFENLMPKQDTKLSEINLLTMRTATWTGLSDFKDLGLKPAQDTFKITGTIQTTDLTEITGTEQETSIDFTPSGWEFTTPAAPKTPEPIIPGLPGVFGFSYGGLAFRENLGISTMYGRKTKYKPNILGLFVGGKAPKGQLTGLEPRPPIKASKKARGLLGL